MSARTTLFVIALMALAASISCNQKRSIPCQWYALFGGRTANGDLYDAWAMTGAHPTLPFGTQVKVTYGSHEQVLTINDRPRKNDDLIMVTSGVQAKLHLPRGVIEQCTIEY